MKSIFSVLATLFLLVGSAFAQTDDASKKMLTAEDVAGKTFVYLDGAWGNHSFYLRKDGTFRVCGGPKVGCDEGTWSIAEGKLVRVYKTWFGTRNHRPAPITLAVNGAKGVFGALQADVLNEDDKFPLSPLYDDPRKK